MKRVVIMVSALCWFGAIALGNIVANGDFEGGTFPATFGTTIDILPNFWSLLPPDTPAQTDTNVVAASAFSQYVNPDPGSFYVAFESQSVTTEGQDCLTQEFPTIAGASYTISFWVAMTANAVANTFLTAQWDANGSNNIDMGGMLLSSSSGAASTAFTEYTFTEVASESSTTFFFHATDASGAILIDDLVITEQQDAPEPASLLLMSFGILIAGMPWLIKRRRRSASYRHLL